MDPAGTLDSRVTAMERMLAARANQIPLPDSPPRHAPSLPIAMPEWYDGDPDQCKGFLMQCGIYVEEHPEMFTTPGAEVRFTLSLLTGRAREWATALWVEDSPLLQSGRERHPRTPPGGESDGDSPDAQQGKRQKERRPPDRPHARLPVCFSVSFCVLW
uniref:DUF4939 domain-containing protein n=1 Tax=Paramormyrops kingsleyae TaxID=1676925 RepID=A0A3B3RUV1_9TELE